jgi:hypothetical protein
MESGANKYPKSYNHEMKPAAANNRIVLPRLTGLSLRDDLHLHEDVLRHIATFLDFQSLRQFSLVSREWNAAGLSILLKRGTYDLTHHCHGNDERSDLHKEAIRFSSWKISHSVYESAEFLHENGIWQSLKSLTIHQTIPMKRGFCIWAWETIQTRCPNLQELTFIFESVADSELDREVKSDYKQAMNGTPNLSFPTISSRNKLASVRFKGICDKTTVYFAQNLLEACNNLRHLHFSLISEPIYGDAYVYRIYKFLEQNPALLKNLRSFGLTIEHYSTIGTNSISRSVIIQQYRFMEFLKQSNHSSLQFSENLTTFVWESTILFQLHGHLFPAILTSSLASSLIQLSLSCEVVSLEPDFRPPYLLNPTKISYPELPRLRVLKLGLYACQSLSVPELVDSAPNLHVLEMKGNKEVSGSRKDSNYFWRICDKESYSNPKHTQLRSFSTDKPFNGLSTLGMILGKFPNLVHLRLGTVSNVGLDPFLSFVQSNHPQLHGLSWTFKEKITVDDLLRHVTRLPELLPNLQSYSLGHLRSYRDIQWPISMEVVKNSANLLLSLPSKSESFLDIHLLLKFLNCHYCNPDEESFKCKQCYLHQFIRKHNLPIRIASGREIAETERKWNHRLASTWISKQ